MRVGATVMICSGLASLVYLKGVFYQHPPAVVISEAFVVLYLYKNLLDLLLIKLIFCQAILGPFLISTFLNMFQISKGEIRIQIEPVSLFTQARADTFIKFKPFSLPFQRSLGSGSSHTSLIK